MAIIAILQAPAYAANMSQTQEIECGQRADIQLQKLYTLSRDPRAIAWVTRIGQRLIPYSDQPAMPCVFRVLDERSIDAFSVPGYVYVSSGLLDLIGPDQNRDEELAGVIAHELGHMGGHDVARELATQKNPVFNLLTGMVMRKKGSLTTDIGGDLYLLGHSSDDEIDADRRAVDTMSRAGIDPNGLVYLYRKLLHAQEGAQSDVIYLDTHPDVANRLDQAQQRIADDLAHGAPVVKAG
jgi:predicted Zn-dependent protease